MKTGLVIAVASAGLAVGAAGWSASRVLGGRGEARSATAGWNQRERPQGGAGGPAPAGGPSDGAPAGGVERRAGPGVGGPPGPRPAWVQPLTPPEGRGWAFMPVRSVGEAARAMDVGIGAVESAVTGDTGLGALGGASKFGLVRAWSSFVRPLLLQDAPAFEAAVAAMGGVAAASEEGAAVRQVYDRLSTLLALASIDWGAASTRIADAGNRMDVPAMGNLPRDVDFKGGVPMMTMVIREEGPEGTIDRRAVSVPLQTIFPSAARAAEAGAPTVELWVPAAMPAGTRARPDAGVAVFMAWDAAKGSWAPIAMRVTLETEAAQQAFAAARGG